MDKTASTPSSADLEPLKRLAARWLKDAKLCREQAISTKNATTYSKICWQRYLDYERRAHELLGTIRYIESERDANH